jgi:hypothetical protein
VTESVVLCEGYHDRAFWAGLLLFLGCNDPGIKQGIDERVPVSDIRGDPVTQGQFYYYTFCSTVGGAPLSVIKQYIENQKNR